MQLAQRVAAMRVASAFRMVPGDASIVIAMVDIDLDEVRHLFTTKEDKRREWAESMQVWKEHVITIVAENMLAEISNTEET